MKDLKICSQCCKEYQGRGKFYCSIDCRNKSRIGVESKRKLERKPCEFCKEPCKRATTRFCSVKCRAASITGIPNGRKGFKQSDETIKKRILNTDQLKKEESRKRTMLTIYGVDNPMKIEEFKEKSSIKARGRKNPRTNTEHQQKIIHSKRNNGTINHTEETKQKLKQILKERFSDPNFDKSIFLSKGSNGKNSKTGYYNGLYFRSSYEEMFLKFCEKYGIIVESAGNKNHCIKYKSVDGTIRSYFPDFYLPESETTIEIKPVSMLDVGENPNKFDAALTSLENYVILTELDGFLHEEDWDEFYSNNVRFWSNNETNTNYLD